MASDGSASRPPTFIIRPFDSCTMIGRPPLSKGGGERSSPPSPSSPSPLLRIFLERSGSCPFREASSPLRLGSSPEPCFSAVADEGDDGDDECPAPTVRIVIR